MTTPALADLGTDSSAEATVRADVWTNGRVADSTSLPAAAGRLMDDLFARLSAGEVVTLIPQQAHITIDQASDVLQVSRAFIAELIKKGEVPTRGTGLNLRIRYADLMAYKRRNDAKREEALAELTALSQEMGLY